jgi:hypothetical protein
MIISGDSSRIAEMINSLGHDVRNLLKQAIQIAWYSRGSIQYETALGMSPLERDIAVELVNERIESQKKSMYPVY